MIHHLSIAVPDLARSARFYDACLSALGYARVWTASDAIGYGPPDGGDGFAIKSAHGAILPADAGSHIAFGAEDRKDVRAFHAAALAAGGVDNGPPGLREHYGPHYYAAFVLDPDGYRIEAVENTGQG